MLSIHLFRQEKERVLAGLRKRHFQETDLVDKIVSLDEEKRRIQTTSEEAAAKINAASKNIGKLMSEGKREEAEQEKKKVAEWKEDARNWQQELQELEETLQRELVKIPNIPHETVPEGRTADDNEIIFETEPPQLSEGALPHWQLAHQYKLIDFELGTKLTGSGFPVYSGQGARLQRGLIQYFLDFNTAAGYTEYQPPLMVNEASAYGTGQLPDKEGQMYHVPQDGLYLIPTSEVPLTNLYRDEIIDREQLPIKMTAYTPCFRREAGSYGKDVRGLNRLHQFDKVEIVEFSLPDKSYEALERMVKHVEKLLQSLQLPYRILRLCGGDMGFTSALTYDFEVFSAAQKRWLEVSSVSNFETFQTNRMKIRYKNDEGKTDLLHSLNGSSLALPRILACLLENNQQEDGILLPEALWSYVGKRIQ